MSTCEFVQKVECGSTYMLASTKKNELFFWGVRYSKIGDGLERQLSSCSEASENKPENLSDYIKIGSNNLSLMKIVEKIGPDFPVLQIKDPKVIVDNYKQLCMNSEQIEGYRCDVIFKPQAIVALYSSQVHLQYGETISMSNFYRFDDDNIYIIVETTISEKKAGDSMRADGRSFDFNSLPNANVELKLKSIHNRPSLDDTLDQGLANGVNQNGFISQNNTTVMRNFPLPRISVDNTLTMVRCSMAFCD